MKILFIDIESAPNVVTTWGLFNQNVGLNQIIAPGYMLSFSAKWYKEDKIMFGAVWKGGKEKMLNQVHKLLDKADIVIGYNSTRFDMRYINSELITSNIKPPAPYKQIDLMKIAKNQFRFASNKLDFVSRAMGCKAVKRKNRGHDLWMDVMRGDKSACKEMEEYNKDDIPMLEEMYEKMLPWIKHPNVAVYNDHGVTSCMNCGGLKLTRQGYAYTPTNKYQQYKCLGCGKWMREAIGELGKEDRANLLRSV